MTPDPPPLSDPLPQAFLELSTTNVSDALDRLRLSGAPRGILPLWPGCPKIAGRAVTMKLVPEGPDSPVLGTLAAIATGRPGEVLVIDHAGRADVNSFGGVAAFTARRQGLAGAVADGVTRDVDEMQELDFPVYGRGIIQQSIRNRCAFAGNGIEVRLGGAAVRPGDLVMADANGVVIVPADRLEEALKIARECAETEERIREWIRKGVDPIEAHERVRYDQMTESGHAGPSSG